MKRLALILFALAILSIPAALAYEPGKVAYILNYPPAYWREPVTVLQDMGFTVETIASANAAYVDYSKYDFILVHNDRFTKPLDIPVNTKKALIMNSKNMVDWHWSTLVSYDGQNVPMKIYNAQPGHIITDGIPEGMVQIHDRCCFQNSLAIPVYYLSRRYRSPYIDSVMSTEDNIKDAVIATAVPGTRLKDSVISNAKTVFFGIFESEYWTANGENLFRNSVAWLMTDTVPPVITGISVVDITETTARVTWTTDKASDSTVEYGLTRALGGQADDAAVVTSHSLVLPGLTAKSLYYYNVTSCNGDGYCATAGPLQFSTKDLTSPVIASLELTDLTDFTAQITVDTDEAATAKVRYGKSSSALTLLKSSSVLALQHVFDLTSLDDHTTYYYQAEVCDASNNCALSAIENFTTYDYTAPGAPLNLIAKVLNPNRVQLDWDMPADDDIAKYNIYIAITPDGFDYNSVHATATETMWEDEGASGVPQRFYVVRAEDNSGNEEENTNVVAKFDIQIEIGPNLISLPLQPFNVAMGKVMHQDAAFHPISEVRTLGADGSYDSAMFELPASWSSNDGLSAMSTNVGYFFISDAAFVFTHVGTPVSSQQSVALHEGSNMVGWTSLLTREIASAVPQTSAAHPVEEVFDHTSPDTYDIAEYEPAPGEWFYIGGAFMLEPGHGYVLKASSPTVWQYTP